MPVIVNKSESTIKVVDSGVVDSVVKVVEEGAQGSPGVPGGGFNLLHNQEVASDHWVINHNLGAQPNITVVDSAGSVVEGDVSYPDVNTVVLDFIGAFSGQAYLS